MTDPLYDDAYIRGVAVGFAEGDSRRETLLRIADRVQHDHPDAKRYRMLRRGQHWSVIDGIGDTLIADGLDAAIDATMLKTPNVQIEPTAPLLAQVGSTDGLCVEDKKCE